jgi:hypothetical protein
MGRRATILLGLATIVATAGGALAQGGMNDACVNQVNGAYDALASQDWQNRFQRSDSDAVQQVAGVWYGEVPNQQLGMIAYIYESFQPNQIFDYRSKTCSNISCSDSYGTGMFAAETQSDGSVFLTTNFSDNNRRNACSGGYVRFPDRNTMVTSDGFTWKRAQ